MSVIYPRLVCRVDNIVDGFHYSPQPLWYQFSTCWSLWDNLQLVSVQFRPG
jgi:hypothetical protein